MPTKDKATESLFKESLKPRPYAKGTPERAQYDAEYAKRGEAVAEQAQYRDMHDQLGPLLDLLYGDKRSELDKMSLDDQLEIQHRAAEMQDAIAAHDLGPTLGAAVRGMGQGSLALSGMGALTAAMAPGVMGVAGAKAAGTATEKSGKISKIFGALKDQWKKHPIVGTVGGIAAGFGVFDAAKKLTGSEDKLEKRALDKATALATQQETAKRTLDQATLDTQGVAQMGAQAADLFKAQAQIASKLAELQSMPAQSVQQAGAIQQQALGYIPRNTNDIYQALQMARPNPNVIAQVSAQMQPGINQQAMSLQGP